MAGYQPLKITGNSTGLVENRENFLLPDDAYPTLQNAYVWRERIKRKKGYQLLGRLQRNLVTASAGTIIYAPLITYNIFTGLGVLTSQPNASIVPGTVASPIVITVGGETFTDSTGTGVFTLSGGFFSSGTINYSTGVLTLVPSVVFISAAVAVTLSYNPNLPVMGIRIRELQNSANDQTIFFDQMYAYIFNPTSMAFQEWIPGTTWNAAGEDVTGIDFFWSTNYWLSDGINFGTTGIKLFWVTNNSGHSGATSDPPRITDGATWLNFTAGSWSQIDATNTLFNWLAMLPYRGRMVVFNTWEGVTAAGPGSAQNYTNRIRWSTIGNPFIPFAAGPPSTGSWRDDIRGQGGFLDIPTSEDIVAIGFVRDNLVIYCERSTWQLRYTGRAIAPFQIEKVNSELGAESTFSAVQFDTSLVGIGDKGIVECDSYKSERIDIKIPDFVFQFNALNNGVARVQGIRDFPNRLAYWTVPLSAFYPNITPATGWIYPTARLVYNYENDSWAIFNDSLTALGNYQIQSSPTWLQISDTWMGYEETWLGVEDENPAIAGGNQQGFIELLNINTVNDPSLFIQNIINGSNGATITSPNHNLQTQFVIGISGIIATSPFSDLNGEIYAVNVLDANTFSLLQFDPISNQFDLPFTSALPGTYIGGGLINIRENFSITSKKFNFLDEGQNIQIGYLDVLMPAIQNGEISLNVYLNYDDETPSNTLYNNQIVGVFPEVPDLFFNSTIPTSPGSLAVAKNGTKFWQRVFCPTRANFITLEYTFSNAQMAGTPQTLEVQIDAQILWIRKGGRLTSL